MTKHIITQTMLHDGLVTLVLLSRQWSWWNINGLTPNKGAKCSTWRSKNLRLLTNKLTVSQKTVQQTHIVSIKGQWEVVCALPNGDISNDLEWP